MALLLLIDDDHSVVTALEMVFTKMGHETIVCMDAIDAISLLDVRRPHAIIADWQLGSLTGIEILASAEHKVPDARRILVTASPGEPEVQEALRENIVQVLIEKPWTLRELRAAVRGL